MRLLFFLTFSVSIFNFFAQNNRACHRIAHVDVEYVLSEWKEVRKVDSIIFQEKLQAEQNFRPIYNEYQNLYQEVSDGKYTGVQLEDKLLKLDQLEDKVQNYNYELKQTLSAKQERMMKPLFDKLKVVIDDLAVEGDYDYVLSSVSGESSIVLFSKAEGDDLTRKVLEKIYQ